MRILRYRQLISHETPYVRSIVDEFTVYNETDRDEDTLTFEADTYRSGLRVFDSDGSELGFYPNEMVRASYRAHADPQGSGFEKEAKDRLEAMDAKPPRSYFLVVPLQPDRKLRSHETRVIRCTWRDSEVPVTIPWKLFSIPEFYIRASIEAHAPFIRHASVAAPVGFELRASGGSFYREDEKKARVECEKPEHYHADTSGTSMHDYALPSSQYDTWFSASYAVYPERNEWLLFTLFFWIYTLVSVTVMLAFLGTFAMLKLPLPAIQNFTPYATLAGTGLLAVGVGFFGLVTNPLTHRTKLWSMIALGCSVVTVLLGPAPHF